MWRRSSCVISRCSRTHRTRRLSRRSPRGAAMVWTPMDPARLRKLLTGVRRGRVSTREALEAIAHLPFESIGSATVDHHRGIRQALPEVIYCEGKSRAQCVAIARAIYARNGRLLATRATEEQARAL